jgi:hypothetical protein
MAIQIRYVSTQGVDAEKAYHRVNSVKYTEEFGTKVTINIYQTKEDYEKGHTPLDIIYYTFTMDVTDNGPNLIKQSYEALSKDRASIAMGSPEKKTMEHMKYNTSDAKKV